MAMRSISLLKTESTTKGEKMKTEVKALWLAALRSGEYAQGSQRLRHSDDTFCCLGVLCDLAVKAGVIPEPERVELGSYEYGAHSNSAFLPDEVAQWADVDRFGQKYDDTETSYDLAQMNDGGATFEAIAAVVEAAF
jgi:hypothetical protein